MSHIYIFILFYQNYSTYQVISRVQTGNVFSVKRGNAIKNIYQNIVTRRVQRRNMYYQRDVRRGNVRDGVLEPKQHGILVVERRKTPPNFRSTSRKKEDVFKDAVT